MRRILILALLFVFAGLSVGADSIHTPKGFIGRLWNGTLALYGQKGKATHFLCTAEPIAKTKGGYLLLSAGHCVQETPADIKFFVADEISGEMTPVTVVKAHDGVDGNDEIDFATFDLKTTKQYPVFELGTDRDLRVGDKVINPHFALGLGKQISYGIISSTTIVKSEECHENGCLGNFLVQDYAGAGASGSAVLSAKTHKVIGIMVFEFGAQVGFAVEPIDRFQAFLDAPVQAPPVEDADVSETK